MNAPEVGRVLPASLHQGIAEVLPSRLDFYEEWLNPVAMRDGRIGVAPLAAVLSFLRREGDAYRLASERGGECAAEWTFMGLSRGERALVRRAPVWLRLRLVSWLMRRLARGTYGGCRVRVTWNGHAGLLELRGSLFCAVRERVERPLCDYYVAAMRRLMELAELPSTVDVNQCRAREGDHCRMALTLRSQ